MNARALRTILADFRKTTSTQWNSDGRHFWNKEKTSPAGCSKRPFSKAAGESKPEAYPLGYVEDFDEPRTKLEDFFNVLLASS
jgi:hypothetical protein